MSIGRRRMRTATREILYSLKANLEMSINLRNKTDLDKDLPYKVSMATRVKVLQKFINAINKLQIDDPDGALEIMKTVHKQAALSLNQIKKMKLKTYDANLKYYRDTIQIIYLQIKALKHVLRP